MVYDWDGKRDICYKMYIQDKKALEEIMEYMRVFHQFAPSKRAFQTQFKRWGFPSKQNPAHKNAQLVARIRELWECNTTQRDMLRILNEEGFSIKERELMRVRARNRWLLRVPNGMKVQQQQQQQQRQPQSEPQQQQQPQQQEIVSKTENPHDQDADMAQIDEAALLALQREGSGSVGNTSQQAQLQVQQQQGQENPQGQLQGVVTDAVAARPPSPPLSPTILAKRKERLEELKAESESRWAQRRRRRRTRGWAGLPADPPGPPRFPSETTIDESKQYLRLDNERYRELREHFQRICEEGGFIKKTIAGPEKWQAAKDRLIQESSHLQNVFWGNQVQLEAKALALDVVCTDVTKRMRTLERRMTIAEAKNVLGINPEESRDIRNAFYNTLKADHFTSKLEAGDEHWKELKERWIQESELLQRILAPKEEDPEHFLKLRATEVLCRDVMKRLRDDQANRDPTRKRSSQSSGSKAKKPATTSSKKSSGSRRNNTSSFPTAAFRNGISTLASQALASAPMVASEIGDMQIDPSLLQAANDPNFGLAHQQHHHASPDSYNYVDPLLPGAAIPAPAPAPTPTPIYLRIHPQSQVHSNSKMWLDKLSTRSLDGLRQVLHARFKHTTIMRIEGVEKAENGQEVSFVIEEDHDLDAYLTHVQGRKATFVFLLNP